jgi:hypothetical protein
MPFSSFLFFASAGIATFGLGTLPDAFAQHRKHSEQE